MNSTGDYVIIRGRGFEVFIWSIILSSGGWSISPSF
jgi:hypothetical protein